MTTIKTDSHVERLLVLHDESDVDSGYWQPLVANVGRVVGMEASYLPEPGDAEQWLPGVLRVAAASSGPVLVLPRRQPGEQQRRPPVLHWAVIASDDSPEVEQAARLCTLHLLRSGVRTTILLVLTESSAPPMWEGPGHHAAAWRHELKRRYGGPDRLQVLTGPPGPTIRQHCTGADLIVLLWRQAIAVDRAPVVRSVLDSGVSRPCLLVPLRWMTVSKLAAGVPLPERAGAAGR